ncbi:MAG: hypothetical protein LM550_14500 [Candidatus Contendobacter sp.]|nr:hypothetical protein [Candidatus Contendobacter sp.]
MKNIRVTIFPNANRGGSESVVIRLMMLAPVIPPTQSPRVLGHWYSDGFEGGFGRPLIQSKQGTYHVLSAIPPRLLNRQEYDIFTGDVQPMYQQTPLASFFDPRGIGGSLPFMILSGFDLFAPRPADWSGVGRILFATGVHALDRKGVTWVVE